MPEESRARWSIGKPLLVFLIALAARWGWLAVQSWRGADITQLQFDDEHWYWRIAESIQSGQGLVGEFGHRVPRMPLYPAFLSLIAGMENGVVWAKAWQALLGAASAVFITLTARRITDERTGLVAGLLVAIDPLLVGVSCLLLTETLFVTLVAGLWWAASGFQSHECHPLRVGVALPSVSPLSMYDGGRSVAHRRCTMTTYILTLFMAILAVYTRPSSLLLVGGVAMFLAFTERTRRRGVLIGAGLVAAVLLSLVPWGFRNYSLTSHFTLLDHRAGISLYDGVRPGATGASDLGPVKTMPAVQGMKEADWNAYFERESWKYILEDPGRIARLAFVKWGRMWSPILNAEEYESTWIRIVLAMWTLPFYGLTLLGTWKLRHRVNLVIWLLMPALILSLIHGLYIGSVRYRLGAVPGLAILAARGLASLWQGSRRTQRDN